MIAIRPKLSVTLHLCIIGAGGPVVLGPGPKSCSFSLVLFVTAHLRRGPKSCSFSLVLFLRVLISRPHLHLHCMHMCLVCMAASRPTNVFVSTSHLASRMVMPLP